MWPLQSPRLDPAMGGHRRGGRIVSNQTFHLVDIMPTLCELAETPYPVEFQGLRITRTPGISMVPYWKGAVDQPEDRTLYWQHLNHSAVRERNWKNVMLNHRDTAVWELYDLTEHRSETDNVVADDSALAQELRAKWHAWAKNANAVPFPEFRPAPKSNRPPVVVPE